MEETKIPTKSREFDRFVHDYNSIINQHTGFFNKDISYFSEYKVMMAKRLCKDNPASILDYGCGIGNNTMHLCRQFPGSRIFGFDISTSSVEEASKHIHEATFTDDLATINELFDLVFVTTDFITFQRMNSKLL